MPKPLGPGPLVADIPLRYYPQWKQVPVLETFKEELSVPVYFENDANLGALAELWWGQGSRIRNMAFLKMGAGIGAGLIIDGKIFRGGQGFAGELGYTSFNSPDLGRNQRLCDLFTRYLSVEQLAEDAGALGMVWADSRLSRQKLNFRTLCAAGAEGDFLAQHALSRIARGLGFAISNLLHTLNLDAVVLGGWCSAVSPEFLQQVRAALREQAAWPEIAETPIVLSPSGEQQCAVGAATLILEKAMDDLSLFPAVVVEERSPIASYWHSYEAGVRIL
jgi:predicted NBD/HSP70 family sugar kinase